MMRILVAIDGSEHREAVVDEIAHRHSPADSEVRVISVVEPPHFPTTDPMGGFEMTIYDEIEKYALEVARAAVGKGQPNSVRVREAANSASRRKSFPAHQKM